MKRLTADELLAEARAELGPRPGARDLDALLASDALVVDIRPVDQRDRDGPLPGAIVIDRNALEWRLDPASPHRIAEVTNRAQTVVLVCHEATPRPSPW